MIDNTYNRWLWRQVERVTTIKTSYLRRTGCLY